MLNRVELVGETLYQALETLAEIAPERVKAQITPKWFERYTKQLAPLVCEVAPLAASAIGKSAPSYIATLYDCPLTPPLP